MSISTQSHLPIQDIRNNLIILKDGSMAIILQAGAVNFDLLSEREQLAIIDAFAGFLNSLSFAVQILIRSRRLDISNYLALLEKAYQKQTNPLLAQMMAKYKVFIDRTIKDNEVLDKQFYIVVQASYLELGILKNMQQNIQKAATILIPRRDHIVRQFARIGLKVTQLDTDRLVRLMYDIYNESYGADIPFEDRVQQTVGSPLTPTNQPTDFQSPSLNPQPTTPSQSAAPALTTTTTFSTNLSSPIQPTFPQSPAVQKPVNSSRINLSAPFVVEELPDEYGAI